MAKQETISVVQFSKLKGVTEEAVRKAIRTKRITATKVNGKLKINPIDALAQWEANTDEKERLKALEPTEQLNDEGKGSQKFPPFSESRAIREAYQARVTKLDYEKKQGSLVDVAEVKESFYNLGRFLREAILNIPSKLASELAAETEPYKIEKMLERELRQSLEELSRSKYNA